MYSMQLIGLNANCFKNNISYIVLRNTPQCIDVTREENGNFRLEQRDEVAQPAVMSLRYKDKIFLYWRPAILNCNDPANIKVENTSPDSWAKFKVLDKKDLSEADWNNTDPMKLTHLARDMKSSEAQQFKSTYLAHLIEEHHGYDQIPDDKMSAFEKFIEITDTKFDLPSNQVQASSLGKAYLLKMAG